MNLILFINGSLGLKVLDYVTGLRNLKVISVYLNSEDKRLPNYISEVRDLLEEKNLKLKLESWAGELSQIENEAIDIGQPTFGVSALFGHILPERIISRFSGGIINLHPSLLPIGRGANPISWSIVNEKVQGISIHLIDPKLDSGDIIFQKEISTTIDMNAGDIYELATSELLKEFSSCFPRWVSGERTLQPQGNVGISQHRSSDLMALQILDENEVGTFGNFVRRMQATTFSNGKRPKFRDKRGKVWEVTFRISDPQINKE